MAPLNRRLLRAAERLQAAYSAVRSQDRELELPQDSWLDAQRILRRCTLACSRGWPAAAAYERQSLVTEIEHLGVRLREFIRELQPIEAPPTLRTLYDELVATEAEFAGLEVKGAEIVVTTESIVLEEIRLGPFQIRFDFARLGSDAPYTIAALEPNPAASCSETTHPHVRSEQLCAGDGRHVIAAAIQQGRLFDFFTIVNQILHTYAVGAAYVEMGSWHGAACHDCDCFVDDEDVCSCAACDVTICSECLYCCDGCSGGYCSACIDRCARCEDRYCSGCLSPCSRCRQQVCDVCRDETICTKCLKELYDESEEQPDKAPAATTSRSAEPAV